MWLRTVIKSGTDLCSAWVYKIGRLRSQTGFLAPAPRGALSHLHVSDWSVVRIYLHVMRLIGPYLGPFCPT
eukprot:4934440-Pyramimonas_sp.AAC.2